MTLESPLSVLAGCWAMSCSMMIPGSCAGSATVGIDAIRPTSVSASPVVSTRYSLTD